MPDQPGFFDADEGLRALSAAGDQLERRRAVMDLEPFRPDLDLALARADRSRGGGPPYDAVLMFRILVLQALYTLSDEQTEYQPRDRLSFLRFVGLALHEAVPDAETIWRFREQLTRAGALARPRRSDRDGRWTIKRGRKPAPAVGRAATPSHDTHGDAGVRLQKPHRHRPRARLDPLFHRHRRRPS
jgi:Transposase domain (DUF772)